MERGIIKMCNVEDYILEQGLEQKRESRDIWDYCFECSKPLTADMQEGKEWFNIRNNGESFPICKECKEKGERGELDKCICNEGIHDKNKIDCSCECHK